MLQHDWNISSQANIEAIKLMTSSSLQDVTTALDRGYFVVCRIFETFAGRMISPSDFVGWHFSTIHAFYQRGVRWFEIHNEPNLTTEGWRSSWADGAQFNDWFVEVVRLLKETNMFPGARWGFPGLSPGDDVPNLRANSEKWLDDCAEALGVADWISIHCYWIDWPTMNQAHAGRYWKYYTAITNKPLMITECNNSRPDVSEAEQAGQALSYYKQLQNTPIKACFWFALSGSNPEWKNMYWRNENGTPRQIVKALGERSF